MVSVSVSMSVSRSVCIGVRVGVQPGDSQHSLPHSAALSAFPFKHHLPTLALPPPLPTPGEIVPPLMRSHILMSSDVSGIPSFPPPLPSLCVASLREHTHTLRSLVKT